MDLFGTTNLHRLYRHAFEIGVFAYPRSKWKRLLQKSLENWLLTTNRSTNPHLAVLDPEKKSRLNGLFSLLNMYTPEN